jgi:hypothetical protein
VVGLALGCSAPPSSRDHGPPLEPDTVVIRNCRFVDSQDATVDLTLADQDFSTALTWENFRDISAVDSTGGTHEVGSSYSRIESDPDSLRLHLHLTGVPRYLVIDGFTAASGPSARLERQSVDDLVDLNASFGAVTGTISEFRSTPDGIVLAISFSDDELATDPDWRFLGVDDLRIRQGSRWWVTRLTSSEPSGDGGLTQNVGLVPLRPGVLNEDERFILTTGGIALERIAQVQVAWPSACRPR